MRFENGATVEFKGRRGTVRGVVVRSRFVRARRRRPFVEYTVAPVNGKEGIYYTVHEDALRAVELRASDRAPEAAVAAQREVETNREANDAGRKEERRCTLADLGIKPGVRVLIRGRNCADWEAEVVDVNFRTGKFAIKRDDFTVAKAVARADLLRSVGRQGVVRALRWISPVAVKRILN